MSTATIIRSSSGKKSAEKCPTVNMAQIEFVSKPGRARAVVGSCIGLSLFHPRLCVGSLAHIVLPQSGGREGPPGKFADTAIPFMVEELRRHGAQPNHLVAKLCGGANMFESKGPLQIGRENADAVRAILQGLGIRILAENIGGTKGRRLTFDAHDGSVLVEVAGQDPVPV